MKKYLFVLLSLTAMLFVGCEEYVATAKQEQPVLYWKDIDVVVVSNTTYSWFAGTHHYKQTITVKSDEYNLEKTLTLTGSGAFMKMPYWRCQEGDIIKAELYSWKMESTGEIVNREINRLN